MQHILELKRVGHEIVQLIFQTAAVSAEIDRIGPVSFPQRAQLGAGGADRQAEDVIIGEENGILHCTLVEGSRSTGAGKLSVWLKDAQHSGLYAMQRFARTLRSDIDAVRNAIIEQWSNGKTEGRINRLKTLKRAMYGRAGPELLRARVVPV